MLNQTGITKTTAVGPNQILMFTDPQVSVGVMVNNTGIDAGADGKKIIKAGTPITGDLTNRGSAFTKATLTSGTKGTWTCEITTAFAADEKITINGVTYTKGTTQSATDKVFAGSTAADQATSLVAIVSDANFTLTNSSGTITFTQKTADSTGSAPTVTKTATTGAIGSVTAGTSAVDGTSNAVGVLLHDVDVTSGTQNATLLIFGFVDLGKLDDTTAALIVGAVKIALNAKVNFLR